MKPGTARSHSGRPCTSSCTPLGLHQSEEENVFSCDDDDNIAPCLSFQNKAGGGGGVADNRGLYCLSHGPLQRGRL